MGATDVFWLHRIAVTCPLARGSLCGAEPNSQLDPNGLDFNTRAWARLCGIQPSDRAECQRKESVLVLLPELSLSPPSHHTFSSLQQLSLVENWSSVLLEMSWSENSPSSPGSLPAAEDLSRRKRLPSTPQSSPNLESSSNSETPHGPTPIPLPRSIDWWGITWHLALSPSVPSLDPVPPGFRLIDVKKKSVIQAPEYGYFEYVCLSYVWGQPSEQDLFATRENIEALEKDGSLTSAKLPATILDAMDVCNRLHQRYLWVDRLCIIQDDKGPRGHKQLQIEHMGDIYNHASLTIAATAGEDPNSGLHGVSVPLASSSDSWRERKWATRGWTYQEAILSRRLILFHMSSTILELEERSEEIDCILLAPSLRLRPPAAFHGSSINYKTAVEGYSRRNLSYQSDAMDAFSGACDYLFGAHRFCLPETGFGEALSWIVSDPLRERRLPPGNSMYPSWSWLSIKGRCDLPENYECVFPVAIWAFVDTNAHGEQTLVPCRPLPMDSEDEMPTPSMFCTTSESDHLEEEWSKIWIENFGRGIRQTRTARHEYREYWRFCQGTTTSRKRPRFFGLFSKNQRMLAAKSPGRVLGLSRAVSCKIGDQILDEGLEQERAYTIKHGSRCIGIVWFDDLEDMQSIPDTKVMLLAVSIASLTYRLKNTEARTNNLYAKLFLDPKKLLEIQESASSDGLSLLLEKNPDYQKKEDVLNVIAVGETEEAGVFRRIGSGIVDRWFWSSMDQKWLSMVLE